MTRPMLITLILPLAGVAGAAVWSALPQDHGQHDRHRQPGHHAGAPLAPPRAIHTEHEHLREKLAAARSAGGQTATHADEVARLLDAHFEDEEAYAMPPLGLLEPLARGEKIADEVATEAIAMADRLRANYQSMLGEHKTITAALEKLASAAREEGKPEHAAFAESLILHAQNEEQVLYPATLVIGDYLKLRRQRDGQ